MENTPFSNNLTSILLSKFLQEAGQTFEFKILDPNTEVGRALSLEKGLVRTTSRVETADDGCGSLTM